MTAKPHLPPSPIDEGKVTVTAIESVQPLDLFPDLLLVRIHTDAGLIGHGETYYCAEAVQAMLHDWMARRLLGEDALAIESHWRFLYERAANFGVRGTEIRALSALDVALWDILGQVCNQPIYRLLGGPVRDKILVYNSCGNPQYGPSTTGRKGWPGFGAIGEPGPLGDSWKLFHEPVALAEELVELGYSGLKVWPFDQAAIQYGPARIPHRAIEEGVQPLREIRDKVGMDLDIFVDGHAHFQLPAALRIAEALREVAAAVAGGHNQNGQPRHGRRLPPPEPDAHFRQRDAVEPRRLQLRANAPSRRLRNDRPNLGRRNFRDRAESPIWRRPTMCRSACTTAPAR